jgi:hypothetical protein
MEKVDFVLKNGRTERMHPKLAELLQRKGKGTYRTTAVQESPQRVVLTPAAHIEPPVVHDVREEPADIEQEPEIDLASMSVEELREHAKRQGVQVHHRAGAATILQALSK